MISASMAPRCRRAAIFRIRLSRPSIVAGAAPTFNTDLNFGTTNDVKYGSQDRYLLGGQIGTAWAINPHINALFGVAYYDFTNIQGRLSTPCNVLSTATVCSTDDLRPSFAQNGNTYMTLRNIIPTQGTGSNMNDTVNQFQYFGLASAFREVDVSGRVDFGYFHPINIVLDGEFVDNTAFNKAAVGAVAVNNIGGLLSSTSPGTYAGGNIGWMTRLTVGHEELRQFGDWNVNVGYKYLQSDAVVDAFADADFGLGGTQPQGYLLGANLAITPSVWTSRRLASADSIAGPPFAVDVLMLNLNANIEFRHHARPHSYPRTTFAQRFRLAIRVLCLAGVGLAVLVVSVFLCILLRRHCPRRRHGERDGPVARCATRRAPATTLA